MASLQTAPKPMSSNSRCQRRSQLAWRQECQDYRGLRKFVRFADGPFVNRIERWPAVVHAHLCGLMTILRLQAADGRTIPLGCPVQQNTQTAQLEACSVCHCCNCI